MGQAQTKAGAEQKQPGEQAGQGVALPRECPKRIRHVTCLLTFFTTIQGQLHHVQMRVKDSEHELHAPLAVRIDRKDEAKDVVQQRSVCYMLANELFGSSQIPERDEFHRQLIKLIKAAPNQQVFKQGPTHEVQPVPLRAVVQNSTPLLGRRRGDLDVDQDPAMTPMSVVMTPLSMSPPAAPAGPMTPVKPGTPTRTQQEQIAERQLNAPATPPPAQGEAGGQDEAEAAVAVVGVYVNSLHSLVCLLKKSVRNAEEEAKAAEMRDEASRVTWRPRWLRFAGHTVEIDAARAWKEVEKVQFVPVPAIKVLSDGNFTSPSPLRRATTVSVATSLHSYIAGQNMASMPTVLPLVKQKVNVGLTDPNTVRSLLNDMAYEEAPRELEKFRSFAHLLFQPARGAGAGWGGAAVLGSVAAGALGKLGGIKSLKERVSGMVNKQVRECNDVKREMRSASASLELTAKGAERRIGENQQASTVLEWLLSQVQDHIQEVRSIVGASEQRDLKQELATASNTSAQLDKLFGDLE